MQLKGVSLPVPDLPVGRLVETPAEISGVIDAFLADGVLDPTSVAGHRLRLPRRRLPAAVQSALSAGLGGTGADALITNQDVDPTNVGTPPARSWTADQLRIERCSAARHDLVYLAGHFSANNLLAADYSSTVNATELTASTVDLANSLVLSAGCHSGYTIVDGDVDPQRDAGARLDPGVRPEAGDGDRRHRATSTATRTSSSTASGCTSNVAEALRGSARAR